VFAQQLVDAGATRLGCSASVAIVKGEGGAQPSGY
ncbi:MAG: 2-deoxyribose-5-phosphate aldolase, partial [Sphingobacteriales bacterium]